MWAEVEKKKNVKDPHQVWGRGKEEEGLIKI